MGVGQSVIFWQPRGDRGATMEEGEVQIYSLIPQLFHFLVEMTPSGKSK